MTSSRQEHSDDSSAVTSPAPPSTGATPRSANAELGFVKRQVIRLTERSRVVYIAKVLYLALVRHTDVFLVSFPKSGRTWLRVMLGFALADHVGMKVRYPLRFTKGKPVHPDLPVILARHDDSPQYKAATAVFRDKRVYRRRKVILLVRDPRDVIVSWYLHVTHRMGNEYEGTLSEFVRDPVGSLASMLAFYDAWAAQLTSDHVLLVRYEDIKADPAHELRRVLDFIAIGAIRDDAVRRAIERASFQRLQRAEREGSYKGRALSTATPDDPESFKVRRGKVGGYVDYLSDDDIAYINAAIDASPGARRFGYAGDHAHM